MDVALPHARACLPLSLTPPTVPRPTLSPTLSPAAPLPLVSPANAPASSATPRHPISDPQPPRPYLLHTPRPCLLRRRGTTCSARTCPAVCNSDRRELLRLNPPGRLQLQPRHEVVLLLHATPPPRHSFAPASSAAALIRPRASAVNREMSICALAVASRQLAPEFKDAAMKRAEMHHKRCYQ
ncbi:uncharacterized protein LOC112885346 [Panicum hallii]|uniref:uncharacterized protein LOC112885346 n=1 Tax=Panicum hallii TaxID=206008 RepID=UPI000DF4DED7|nr:uncharacterized protein LOC112885346 [Panicum hallii]